jgi:hypothetical protein
MRRRALALLAVVAAAATCAPAVAATSHTLKPQVHDAGGDWKIDSQDVLDATYTATANRVQVDIHLAAPPAVGVRTDYDAAMTIGCGVWSLHYSWLGGLPGAKATLDQYACPTGNIATDEVTGGKPIASFPATATVTATGLRIVAAPTKAVHRGVKIWGFVETRLEPILVGVGLDWNNPSVGGDMAAGAKQFALGS